MKRIYNIGNSPNGPFTRLIKWLKGERKTEPTLDQLNEIAKDLREVNNVPVGDPFTFYLVTSKSVEELTGIYSGWSWENGNNGVMVGTESTLEKFLKQQ